MANRVNIHPNLIYPVGTKVVLLREILGDHKRTQQPRGALGVVVKSPNDLTHSYRVRFADGVEEVVKPSNLSCLSKYKEGSIGDARQLDSTTDFHNFVIFRCIIGSQAYGLSDSKSDIDRRGFYLPPADLQWSLYGVPEQLESDETQEAYWEIQKFLALALKANPNVLECLYTPLIEQTTPLVDELLTMKDIFLSKLIYQTYNGYVMSQFKKMQTHYRLKGDVKWKHAMHLIRLLISGIEVLQHGFIPVAMDSYRDQLLAIKRGELPWTETEKWRRSLHQSFDQAYKSTKLPERPDYHKANMFLIKARRSMVEF